MRCVFKGTLTTPQEKAHSTKTMVQSLVRVTVLGPYAIYNLVGNHTQWSVSHKHQNERGLVGQLTVKLDVTDCTGTVND